MLISKKYFLVLCGFFLLFSNNLLAKKIELSHVKQYAPLVYLHSDEAFNPSSVEFFQRYMNIDFNNSHWKTKQPIDCASCTNLDFFKGQSVETDKIPVYAMIVPKPNIGKDITDVFYWFFYPYNRGKRVCISPIYTNGNCWGKYSTFGHHVGDWEHVTIRFKDDQPQQLYLAQHNFGQSFDWGDYRVQYIQGLDSDNQTVNMRPILYSAKGSHGTYAEPGEYVYYKIFNGDKLVDKTNKGNAWQTWQNIILIPNNDSRKITKSIAKNWHNYSGRWGNPKRTCTFLGIDFEKIFKSCILNDGPIGPGFKAATNSNQNCYDDEFLESVSQEVKHNTCS